MRAKEYRLFAQCVEIGVRLGWNRAHKHTDTPTEEVILGAIINAVCNEVEEAFTFDQDINEWSSIPDNL